MALDAVLPVVAAQRDYLQTAGIAAGPEELYRLGGLLGAVGVTRISAIGSMSMPEAGWHHDGRFNLLDLVNKLEQEKAEGKAGRLADTLARFDLIILGIFVATVLNHAAAGALGGWVAQLTGVHKMAINQPISVYMAPTDCYLFESELPDGKGGALLQLPAAEAGG